MCGVIGKGARFGQAQVNIADFSRAAVQCDKQNTRDVPSPWCTWVRVQEAVR